MNGSKNSKLVIVEDGYYPIDVLYAMRKDSKMFLPEYFS